MRSTVLIHTDLPLFFQFLDTVLPLRAFVIQLVLLCIDNNHRMLDSTSQFLFRRTTKSHVRDEVRDNAHFTLLLFFFHETHVVGIAFRNSICRLRIKVFQIIQRTSRLNWHFGGDRNSHNGIAVKVCAGQTLCHLGVDTNSILNLSEIALAADIFVVDSNNRNLKGSGMRIANQCKLCAILIGRTVSFRFLDSVDRQNDFRRLSRKCRCFQRHGRTFTGIGKVVQQLLFNSRIIVVHDFIILRLIIRNCKLQLIFNKLFRLFG